MFWLGALLACSLLASVLGFIVLARPLPAPDDFYLPAAARSQVFRSSTGYTVRYPARWTAAAERPAEPGVVEQAALTSPSGRVRVTILAARGQAADPLFPATPRSVALNGLSALRYDDYDRTTATPLTRVIVVSPDQGRLTYELRGRGPIFERIVRSFRLVELSEPTPATP
jgi:hypothetical protein